MRALALILLMGLMLALKEFLGAAGADPMPRAILVFGFLIMAGYLGGCYISKLGLPSITGYMLAGIVCGPYVLGFVRLETVLQFKLLEDLALALIAFTAGGELKKSRIVKSWKSILSISFFQIAVVFTCVSVGFYHIAAYFRPLDVSDGQLMIVSGFVGVIASACSPASAVAVVVGTRSKGHITDLIMGVTVLRDLIVLIGFTIAIAVFYANTTGEGSYVPTIGSALFRLILSIFIGCSVGFIIGGLLGLLRREVVMFVITVALVIVFIAELLDLDYLLICLVAGFVVENFTSLGDRLVGAIERTSMGIYIIFFAMTGVMMDFSSLAWVWPCAIAIVALRIFGTAIATAAGAFVGGERNLFKGFGWAAFLSQAGVSLAVVLLVSRTFPEWGAKFRTLMVSVIAINQIIGPIFLQLLLTSSGETAERHLEDVISKIVNTARRKRSFSQEDL